MQFSDPVRGDPVLVEPGRDQRNRCAGVSAGHNSNTDAPETVNRLIEEFLYRL